MEQDYSKYTYQDQKIWQLLYDRQIDNMQFACKEYKDGVRKIGFVRNEIPHFTKMNKNLSECTGWQVRVVPGWIPENVFFEMLFNRQFPSSTWLRDFDHIDYLEEPDMFHDIFGHVPLLTNQHFVDFLFELSKIGLQRLDNPEALEIISRIYWFTVEFGLIKENGQRRIYGAGILSSPGETKYAMSEKPEIKPFSISEIAHTPFRKDVFQDRYFEIESFEQLYHSVSQIEEQIDTQLAVMNL